MLILRKIIILVILSLLGQLLYSVMFHVIVAIGITPDATSENAASFGQNMTTMATYIWLGAICLGIISLFIQQKWRYVLLFSPLLAPSLFAFIYALTY